MERQHYQHYHKETADLKKVTRAENQINTCQSSSPQKHQSTAPQTFDRIDSHKRKDHIRYTGHHNIKEYITQRITRRLEYFLCIIENHIRTAPLLEHSHDNTQYEYLTERATEQ